MTARRHHAQCRCVESPLATRCSEGERQQALAARARAMDTMRAGEKPSMRGRRVSQFRCYLDLGGGCWAPSEPPHWWEQETKALAATSGGTRRPC